MQKTGLNPSLQSLNQHPSPCRPSFQVSWMLDSRSSSASNQIIKKMLTLYTEWRFCFDGQKIQVNAGTAHLLIRQKVCSSCMLWSVNHKHFWNSTLEFIDIHLCIYTYVSSSTWFSKLQNECQDQDKYLFSSFSLHNPADYTPSVEDERYRKQSMQSLSHHWLHPPYLKTGSLSWHCCLIFLHPISVNQH